MDVGRPLGVQNGKRKMKNITINLPQLYVDTIQELIEKKMVPSRSEAIRLALRDYIREDLSFKNKMENNHDGNKNEFK